MPEVVRTIRCVGVWVALLGVVLNSAARATGSERSNFVIFVADDMNWDDCGAYGHPHIRTPNIDGLAKAGMRFDRAFLTCSSCSPSRASILTSRYPHATGAAELHQPVPAGQVLLTQPLREAGYYTAAVGKWHLGDQVRDRFDLVDEKGPTGAERWVQYLHDRPKDKPFFFWLASRDPHRPYKPGAIATPHTPADAVVPPYLPDVEAVRKDLALYYDAIARLDGYVGAALAELDAQKIAGDTFVLFISDNGRPFPQCKTTVYDDGIRTPFIIRYPGRVKAGSTSGSVVSAVDIAPTILELAGVRLPDRFQGLSFARLLTDPSVVIRPYAFSEHNWHDYQAYERGVRSPRYTYVRNWLPELTQSPPADAVVSPTFQAMQSLFGAGKLTDVQSQPFIAPRPPEELYDSESDPHALHNLVADPQYAATLAELRSALDDWRKKTGDDFDRPRLTRDKFDRATGEPLK